MSAPRRFCVKETGQTGRYQKRLWTSVERANVAVPALTMRARTKDRARHFDDVLACLRGGVGQAEVLDTIQLVHPSDAARIDWEREEGRFVISSHVGVNPDGTYKTRRCGRFYRADDARAALATAGFALNQRLGVWNRNE